MKRLVCLCFCCLFCFGLAAPAVAAEAALVDAPAEPSSPSALAGQDTSVPASTEQVADAIALAVEKTVTKDLQDTPAQSGLAATMSSIFGEYTPRTYQVVTEVDGVSQTTTEVVPGLAGLDWPYICSVVLFAVMLLGLYKLMGVVLR